MDLEIRFSFFASRSSGNVIVSVVVVLVKVAREWIDDVTTVEEPQDAARVFLLDSSRVWR